MSAQQKYNAATVKLQLYYQQGLMNGEEIAFFEEAKKLGSAPWNILSGFPTKPVKMMNDLVFHIEARQEAAAKSKRNDGSTFRAGIGR